MPQLGQAQTVTSTTGNLRSTPKLTKINGDDDKKVVYRNLGNNHAYPFVWANTATIASGTTSVLLASGIRWHGYDLATFATVVATPQGDIGTYFTTADVDANTITLTCETGPAADVDVALIYMLGNEMVVEGLSCRGNVGAAQNLP